MQRSERARRRRRADGRPIARPRSLASIASASVASVALVCTSLLAACGDSSSSGSSVTARAVGFSTDRECLAERVLLGLATSAYRFQQGYPPLTEQSLIDEQLIDADVAGATIDGGDVVRVDGESCDEIHLADEPLTDDCADAALRLVIAAGIYARQHDGATPSTSGLARTGLAVGDSTYDWYTIVQGHVLPTNEGGCPLLGDTGADVAAQCAADREVLLHAVDGFLSRTGRLPQDQAELVAHGWLDAAIVGYDLLVVDAKTSAYEVVTDGSRCADQSA